jgi:pimeloyl-ACP methyl ester carboxylesterase
MPPEQVAAHEGKIDVDGASIWCWDTGGTGDAIVLLHPLTGSGLVWPYQQPVFARAGYRVIGYSRRGFYNSSSGDPQRPGTAAGDARALLDALGIARCHLIGSAGGAFVVADFALAFPDRLYSQVLSCSMLGIQGGPVGDMSSRLRPEGFEKLPEWCQELSASYRAVDRDGVERWRALQAKSRAPGSGAPLQRTIQPLSLELLAGVAVPTLVIAGDSDLLAPPPVARLLAQTIPGSELKILPECGHSAYWERPDLFNSHVLEFLSRHAGGRGRG